MSIGTEVVGERKERAFGVQREISGCSPACVNFLNESQLKSEHLSDSQQPAACSGGCRWREKGC